ncbi:MAG TPA: metallophosphoesterase [Chitinophagales bacterium]|nr:metallophosphoesterase [Chitinophagales bacterium]
MKNSLLLFCILFSLSAISQSLQRGPYLQSMTNNSVKIMWRTSDSTTAIVKYGTSPTTLTSTITDNTLTKNHIVQVNGLQAKTKYYYSVGYNTTVLAGENDQHHFITAPIPGDSSEFKFWVTGDFGGGNGGQIKVRRWFENYLQGNNVTGWLWLGDNAYNDGTDAQYQAKVFDTYYGYDSIFRFLPFYPIPGNHDYNSVNGADDPITHKGPYYDMVEVFKNAEMGGVPSGMEAYYSYDYGNTHFLALNSELYRVFVLWDLHASAIAFKNWLINDLKSSDKKFKVAYWHQPPYSKGSHDSDDFWEVFMGSMRDKVIPILEQYGVDLILCGHSHVYERSYLINKHYGLSHTFNRNTMLIDSTSGNPDSNRTYLKYTYGANKDKGTVYGVIGNSGKSEPENGKMHPAMYKKYAADGGVGSMILEVKGNQMTCFYYKENGELYDKFRILKQDSTAIISGIRNNTSVSDLKIYPNPFNNAIVVEFDAKAIKTTAIAIQNIIGQLIVETIWTGKSNLGNNRIEINNLQGLPSGEYIITIKQDDEVVSEKIVKF